MTTKNNSTSKTKGAVIYTRVSTGEQDKHGSSPESQREACRAKAESLTLPIIAEYHDGGISGGFLLARPGMQDALADIKAGRADTLITFNIDRYSRDREHQEQIKKAVRRAGGRLVFTDADYQDNAAGNLNFNIRGDFAVFEREFFRERSMLGKVTFAEGGIQTARCLSPFGYHIPTKADVLRGDFPVELLGRYVVREDQAAVVRRIFACYASGTHSMHRLCLEMNAEGIPTPRGASAWRPATIKAILANPVHKGQPAYGKVQYRKVEDRLQEISPLTGQPFRCAIVRSANDPADWLTLCAPPLVPVETWDQAQARTALNQSQKGGQPARVRLLAGRLECPRCGGGMRFILTRKEKYDCYECHRHVEALRAGLPSDCEGTSYLRLMLEAAALLSLLDIAERPASVKAQIAHYREEDRRKAGAQNGVGGREEARQEMAALDRALHDLANDETAAVQAQIAGIRAGASPDAYAAVFGEMAARRKDMEDRRGVLRRVLNKDAGAGKGGARSSASSSASSDEALRLRGLADLRRLLDSPDVPTARKRDLLGTVIEKVIPRKDGAEVIYLPGLLDVDEDDGEDTVQGVSTPQPKNASVRPPASVAPRCAYESTPRAPPETIASPCAVNSRAN